MSALYIKKLSTAIRDGDSVRAVIRSTCINSDGRGASLTTPNPVKLDRDSPIFRRPLQMFRPIPSGFHLVFVANFV